MLKARAFENGQSDQPLDGTPILAFDCRGGRPLSGIKDGHDPVAERVDFTRVADIGPGRTLFLWVCHDLDPERDLDRDLVVYRFETNFRW